MLIAARSEDVGVREQYLQIAEHYLQLAEAEQAFAARLEEKIGVTSKAPPPH
jgi:hypothetical protein